MRIPPLQLGVNIDHIATVREARGTLYPSPLQAAFLAVDAGADGITVHLREDRRHIQVSDVTALREHLSVPLNLEMAATDEMIAFAKEIEPQKCCIVPEKREELTTEGGLALDLASNHLSDCCRELIAQGIEVSLFIEPDSHQVEKAAALGANVVELHTGAYAHAASASVAEQELARITKAIEFADKRNLVVNAGHGLNYHNVKPVAALEGIRELNIGHSIVARALFDGFAKAVSDMKNLMISART